MCKACDKRGKTWSGSDPVCGFSWNESFDITNWNCATLNGLRDISQTLNVIQSMDDASIATIPVNNKEFTGWIILSWYKDRGRTSAARYIVDDTDIPLTLAIAEAAIEQYKNT